MSPQQNVLVKYEGKWQHKADVILSFWEIQQQILIKRSLPN